MILIRGQKLKIALVAPFVLIQSFFTPKVYVMYLLSAVGGGATVFL